nr:SRPBCC family protein [Sphingopyxis sp. PET50]
MPTPTASAPCARLSEGAGQRSANASSRSSRAERIRYELLSGLPVIHYEGLTEFTPETDGRTLVRWTSTFAAETPAVTAELSLYLGRVVRKMVRQVALAAEIPALLDRPERQPFRPLSSGKHVIMHDLPRYQRLY